MHSGEAVLAQVIAINNLFAFGLLDQIVVPVTFWNFRTCPAFHAGLED